MWKMVEKKNERGELNFENFMGEDVIRDIDGLLKYNMNNLV